MAVGKKTGGWGMAATCENTGRGRLARRARGYRSKRMMAVGTETERFGAERQNPRVRRPMRLSTIGLPLVTAWILCALGCSKGC